MNKLRKPKNKFCRQIVIALKKIKRLFVLMHQDKFCPNMVIIDDITNEAHLVKVYNPQNNNHNSLALCGSKSLGLLNKSQNLFHIDPVVCVKSVYDWQQYHI